MTTWKLNQNSEILIFRKLKIEDFDNQRNWKLKKWKYNNSKIVEFKNCRISKLKNLRVVEL